METTVPAEPESLDQVQDLISALYGSTADDLDFTDRMRFEGAVVEIVGNVIEHGRAAMSGAFVRMHVALHRDNRDLRAVITDDGTAVPLGVDFDAAGMPAADAEDGRGLAMARALSSELRYERRDGFNRWIVRCSCPPDDHGGVNVSSPTVG